MDINDLVRKRLEGKDKIEIVKKMGYQVHAKGVESLNYFLSKNLSDFITDGMYDFRYSAEEFFRKLCEVLEIDEESVNKEIQKINEIIIKRRAYEKSYIFVNTNFKRQSQSIFALAFMEGERRLRPNIDNLLFKSDEDVLKEISRVVKTHYHDTKGKLPMWGNIVNYAYHHKNGKVYVFDTDGNLTEQEVEESLATLSVK